MSTYFNIVSHFFEQAERYPDKIAIHFDGQSVSYRQLKFEVLQSTAYFHQKGIRKGDRVLVFVPMSIDLYRNVLALFHLGATAVFLDEWVSKKRLDACCEVADCKAFIGVFKIRLLSFLSKGLRRIPIRLGSKLKIPANGNFMPEPTVPSDTALITFTTGSTGTPKAAKRTHGFLNEQFKALLDKIQPKAEDVDLTTLPIVLLINLGVGSTSVISTFKAAKPEKTDFRQVAQSIRKFGVNRIIASPYFVLELAKFVQNRKQELSSLEAIFKSWAGSLPQNLRSFTGPPKPNPSARLTGKTWFRAALRNRDFASGFPTSEQRSASFPSAKPLFPVLRWTNWIKLR